MKIFPRILLNTLPLILAAILLVGGINYVLSKRAITNLAEKWLTTKLTDAFRLSSDDVTFLNKYGLTEIQANLRKAQEHSARNIAEISIGNSGYLWIVDQQGVVIMHPDKSYVGSSIIKQPFFMQIQETGHGKTIHTVKGDKMLAVYDQFPAWNWYIIACAPLNELYGEAHKMRAYMIGGGIVALLLTTLTLMILARRLTAPLNQLAEESQQIGEGEHAQVTQLKRGDEIGTLSQSFSCMTDQLSNRIAEERLVSEISRQFLQVTQKNIDVAIRNALKLLGEYTDADRCYVGDFSYDYLLVGKTREWCRSNTQPLVKDIKGLSLDAVPWFFEKLTNKEHVLAAHIEDLPQAAQAERDIWMQRGLKSVVRVPMIYGGELRGFVGLDASRDYQPWTQNTVILLKRMAEIFSNSLERQWYQETLAREKERLSVTLQSIGDGVITTDVTGNIVLINRVGEILTGWKQAEAEGKQLNDLLQAIHEKTGANIPEILDLSYDTNGQARCPNRFILISRDGTERLIASSIATIFEAESKKLGIVLVFRDITEKRRMEEELIKVEKLESIGVLAGGIAHDFNNILTAILGNISLAKHLAASVPEVTAKLKEIENASYRARDLTQQLLTFSKGGLPVKKSLSIGKFFYDSAMFSLGGSNISLDFTVPQDIWSVNADEGQLSQVFNNLVINAIQAMPEGGEIRASIKNIVLPTSSTLPLTEGKYVQLSLTDSGHGISTFNLNRIFDPFFTTKSKGSGLGLATAYSILEKHGGYITADSQLGAGTTFTIYLPASDKETEVLGQEHPGMIKGSGSILIMDDEKEIRNIAGCILKAAGYSIAFAADGKEMLDTYQQAMRNDTPFTAVLMDLTIPGGMGGKEAIGQLLKLDKNAKAIVSSGYSNDPVMSDFLSYGFVGAVTKPYGVEQLTSTLSSILNLASAKELNN